MGFAKVRKFILLVSYFYQVQNFGGNFRPLRFWATAVYEKINYYLQNLKL
jgi:hypothetical protein